MQAIIFPITYISEVIFATVRMFFKDVIVYQPTRRLIPDQIQQWSKEGFIGIRIPEGRDDKKLELLVNEYKNWVALHQGGELNYLKLQKGSVPFFDDTSPAHIRSEIKRATFDDKKDTFFNARVFLQIAQEFDCQTDDVVRKLGLTDQAQQNMIRKITGEPPAQTDESPGYDAMVGDATGLRAMDRILAWSQLFLKDAEFNSHEHSVIFITFSRETSDLLIDRSEAAEQILQIETVPVFKSPPEEVKNWCDQISMSIDTLSKAGGAIARDGIGRIPGTGGNLSTANLTLYRIPRVSPTAFFARLAQISPSRPERVDSCAEDHHTLMGLFELN